VLSPAAVKDNSEAGYYQNGLWTLAQGGFNGTYEVADPTKSSNATAQWLMNVPAGSYELWATWVGLASNATSASYSVYDGFTKLGASEANQQLAPQNGAYGGVLWADLGTFSFAKGRVTIILGANGANGDVVADGVLLVPTIANAVMIGGVQPVPGRSFAPFDVSREGTSGLSTSPPTEAPGSHIVAVGLAGRRRAPVVLSEPGKVIASHTWVAVRKPGARLTAAAPRVSHARSVQTVVKRTTAQHETNSSGGIDSRIDDLARELISISKGL
jgi:hypothetical protein